LTFYEYKEELWYSCNGEEKNYFEENGPYIYLNDELDNLLNKNGEFIE